MTIRNAVILSLAAAAVGFAAQAQAAQVGTVFVIAMENHNWTQPNPTSSPQQIFNNPAAPYINSLVNGTNIASSQTAYATNYLNAASGEHPSEPNYVWAEAGTNYNQDTNHVVASDADPAAAALNQFSTTPHLTQQMNAAGVTWKNYQEDYQILNSTTPTGGSALVSKSGTSTTVTNPYYNTNQYNYAAKHNPMVFFNDTQTQNLNTFDQLRSDISADTGTGATNNFGKYNWITPNQFNDMHSGLSTAFTYAGQTWAAGSDQNAIAVGDNFLARIIPAIMATTAYQNNGAIVIWDDESEGGDTSSFAIPEIVISPLAHPNVGGLPFASSVELNHSSDIKTMEEIFQLGGVLNNTLPTNDPTKPEPYGGTAGLNSVAGANDLSSLFAAGTIPSAVPEPASVGVFAMGAAALIARRRKTA